MAGLLIKKCCCGCKQGCNCGSCSDSFGFSWTNLIIQSGPPSWAGSPGDLLNDLYAGITWPRSGTMLNYMTDSVKTEIETFYGQSYDANTLNCPSDPSPTGIWPETYCCNLKTDCTWQDFADAPTSHGMITCFSDSIVYVDGWAFLYDGPDAQHTVDGVNDFLIEADGYSNGICPDTGSISGAFETTIDSSVSLSGNMETYYGNVYPTIS